MLFKRAIQQRPNHVTSIENLVGTLTIARRYDEAFTWTLQLIEVKLKLPPHSRPGNLPEDMVAVAERLIQLGNRNDAQTMLMRALELRPDHVRGNQLLQELLQQLRQQTTRPSTQPATTATGA